MIRPGEYLTIGGAKQWISYDAAKAGKPLLLFLHGGPGWVVTPLLQQYCKPLFENYLVVNWDQRGSGKSYFSGQIKNLTVKQLVADGLELATVLCNKFQKEKIILVGHSWGSALGVLMCQANPGLFYKYVGIGQIGNWLDGELLSYHFVLGKAKQQGKTNLVKQLERNGQPPYPQIKQLIFQRKWLLKFGGSIYGKTNYRHWFPLYLKRNSFNLISLIKTGLGLKKSLVKLWDDCLQLDLCKDAPKLDLPVYMISGRHDFQVPAATSRIYFDKLEAPQKKWYWFENSAHTPLIEEPDAFNKLMLEEILPVSDYPV